MPTAVPSPTALKILLEKSVLDRLTDTKTTQATTVGLVVDHSDIAKMSLADLLNRRRSLGTWTTEESSKPDPSRVMTTYGESSKSNLGLAISQRRTTIRKLARILEKPKPFSDEEYVAAEQELTRGSDGLVVAAWRSAQTAPGSRTQLAERLIQGFPKDSRCASLVSEPNALELENFAAEVESTVESEVRSLAPIQEALNQVQRTAQAYR